MKPNIHTRRRGRRVPWLSAAVLCAASPAAATSVLGSAQGFAILATSTVTNTGATTLTGDLGVAPGTAITGAGTITLTGVMDAGGPAASQAEADALAAYDSLSSLAPTEILSGQDLGALGHALAPGVYAFSSSAPLTGDLVLDFADDPGGAFVFEIGSTLTTAASSAVTVMDGSSRSRIYWLVGSSATLGAGSALTGSILADAGITMGAGSTILYGRAIALNGAVTLDSNTVSNDGGRRDFESMGFSGGRALDVGNGPSGDPPPGVPEPSTWAMLLVGFGLAGGALRRRLGAPSPSGA